MAKKEDQTPPATPKTDQPKTLVLDRTYAFGGEHYGPGEIEVGTDDGQIRPEAVAELTKAQDRARKRDAEVRRQLSAIDEAENRRREDESKTDRK